MIGQSCWCMHFRLQFKIYKFRIDMCRSQIFLLNAANYYKGLTKLLIVLNCCAAHMSVKNKNYVRMCVTVLADSVEYSMGQMTWTL